MITIRDLNPQQIHNIEQWISNLKSSVELYTGRAIDDMDEFMGLLVVIASHHNDYIPYTEAEMIGAITEQYDFVND